LVDDHVELLRSARRDRHDPVGYGLGDRLLQAGGGFHVFLMKLWKERVAAHMTRPNVTDDERGLVRRGQLVSAKNGLIAPLGEIGADEQCP
jgi:hypothetical protein